ncbi:MAG TPA: maleylpyruvate isomerase family mycothiol-dependent enzyme [Pseudonocardiaceae bacterium]|nr:maleylpyruvate isomerase family mycothiol-dependent enzyme [Pseudonocardiaceae bacterium]
MDPIDEWTKAQQRVITLVAQATPEQVARPVPACPDWSVRDLFSHMVGLGADVVAGNEPDDHNEAWTSAQVRSRADHDVPTLVAEWRQVAGPLTDWMRERGPRPLNDVIIHEQDIRGALGVPGAQDTPALAAIRDVFAGRFAARLGDVPAIALVGPGWRWMSASDPEVVVSASDFDLARALVTRRSAAQLRAWTTRGDITAHLPAFALLGALPDADLSE